MVGALVIVVGALAGWAPAAGAHAALQSSSPASGETVPEAPDALTLRFNEPVVPTADAVRLLDVDGEEVAIGDAEAVDATIRVELPDGLPDGSYVVAWKAMSADSHPVSGAFGFAIGAPSVSADGSDPLVAAQAEDSTNAGAQAAVDVAAALAYAGVLLAVGAAIFAVFVSGTATVPPVRTIVQAGAAVGVGGLAAGIVAAAARIDAGLPAAATIGDELLGAVGLQALVGATGLALVIAATRLVGLQPVVRKVLVLDGAAGALAAFVIVGHTRTAAPVGVTIAADIVHLAAAAVWTGGLAALLVTLHRDADTDTAVGADTDTAVGADVADRAAIVARFSGVATVAIVAVAGAGVVLGWRVVGSWSALTGTTYGVLLLVKVALFAVLAAVGGFNRFRLVGRVAGAEPDAAAAVLRRTLVVELVLVLAIVGVTGSFTSISPEEAPAAPVTTPLTCAEVQAMEGLPGMETMDHTCVGTTTTRVPFDPTAGAGGGGGSVTASAAFGDGLAVVTISPATVGANTVSISLTDAGGASIDPEDPPTVSFRLRAQEIGPLTATAERVGPGAYRVTQDLALPGEWEINVSAVVSDFEQPQAVATFDVGD